MNTFTKPLLLVLGIGVLLVTMVLLMAEKQIITSGNTVNDFESCVAQTGIVMESYPRQCSYGGTTYTEVLSDEEQNILDENSNVSDEPQQAGQPYAGECVVTGCSSQLCVSVQDIQNGEGVSTCEYREEYMCYQTALCEMQTTGECGWTQDVKLESCLNSFE